MRQSILLDPYTTNSVTARTAIWAFDILKYPYPELQLLIVDRPEWNQVHDFADSMGRDDHRILFITNTDNHVPILRWKVGPALPVLLDTTNITIIQPTALRLAQETHRFLTARPPD